MKSELGMMMTTALNINICTHGEDKAHFYYDGA